MPTYKYTALDLENKKIRGSMDARDSSHLRKSLRNKELVVVKHRLVEEKYSRYRLKSKEVAEFSRQLATMLASGITGIHAVEIIKNRDIKPSLKAVFSRLYSDASQGSTISEAMLLQPRAFPEMLVNMYASGEASGRLEHVASKMALHYEKEHHLNTKVQSAMIYPLILAIATFAVVMVIFTVVLPAFFDLFQEMPLPLITKIVLGLSIFLQRFWYLVIIVVIFAGVGVNVVFTRIKSARLFADRIKLRLPVAGVLLKTIYTARFSRTLSSLYSSGIPLIRTLEICATIVGNKYIENQFDSVIRNVRHGESLSHSVSAVHGFDSKLATTILIGEETGRLDSMLESGADSFDFEAAVATDRLVRLLEPIMIVVMALIVGSVMMAVVMPLLTMYDGVGGL